MKIEVEIKQVYGNRTIYPLCEKAQAFARIAGTKVLTSQAVEHIKALGYEVCVVPCEPVRL